MLPNLQNRLTFMDSESVDSALGSSSCSEELKVFLQSVIRRTGADQGQMYALDLSVSDSKMDAESLAKQSDRCFWFSGVQEPSKHPRAINIADLRRECLLTKARRCVIPLEKDHEPCGEIVLLFSGNVAGDPGSATLSQIAQEAVRLLDRISVREFAWKTLGLNLPLVGSSRSVQQLQIELARVSNVPYPLVLEAEFGSSDLELAAAVHCYGSRRSQPFVAIHGVFFRIDELGKQVEEVENGTLFIGSVDMLDNATQQTLLSMLRSRRESRNQPRLIVSTSVPLAQLEAEGRLCRFLRAELDVLQMRVPPLRERLEDLSSLFEYFLARHGFEKIEMTPEALRACMRYGWPGNDTEIQRFAIRAGVMNGRVIDSEALQRIAPLIPASDEFAPRSAGEECPSVFKDQEYVDSDEESIQQCEWVEDLARKLLLRDYASLKGFSDCLNRALRFLSEHYQEEIMLSQLAREAYVSISHLSFLFKRDIGVSFKTLLLAIRIEKARQSLVGNARQSITEISLDAGFGDLSHFERTFKKMVGTNPRNYRRQKIAVAAAGGC